MKTNLFLFLLFSLLISFSSAEQCGRQAGGALCPNGLCCSEFGWCGDTEAYCKVPGCQSQCTPGGTPPPGGDLSVIISRSQFEDMLKHRNDAACLARGFYTYDAFITAAKSFPGFGTTGDTAARKKEVAAFFGQTSHETTGGWPTAPDGPFAWGYCFKQERDPSSNYCEPSAAWPCAQGKRYYGRGPMQLTWNYNYGQCGRAIGVDLLNNPDLVANDAVIAFKAAIWFWMTAQPPKPSCHAVIAGQWRPSAADSAAGRVPGYGVITNIINGGLECGHGQDPRVADRIGFYQRFFTSEELFLLANNMEAFDRLAIINPSRSNWRVRVKILRNYFSYDRSSAGDLWLILSDEHWARVHAYVERSCVYELEGFLREGDWKILHHFDVTVNDAPSRLIDDRYNITISRRTIVSDSHPISSNLFASFAPFQTVLDGFIGTNYLIELRGKITRVGKIKNLQTGQRARIGELTDIAKNSFDIDAYRLVFYIEDNNGKEIRCLAMANEALKVAETIHSNYVEGVVCVLRWWKLHEFGPGFFGIKSEDEVSQILINPCHALLRSILGE